MALSFEESLKAATATSTPTTMSLRSTNSGIMTLAVEPDEGFTKSSKYDWLDYSDDKYSNIDELKVITLNN